MLPTYEEVRRLLAERMNPASLAQAIVALVESRGGDYARFYNQVLTQINDPDLDAAIEIIEERTNIKIRVGPLRRRVGR